MHIERSSLLPFSAAQMYQIVTDIEAYPSFLPWCGSARIQRQAALNPDENEVEARLELAYRQLEFSFTTRNRNKHNSSVEIQLLEGPFSKLQGQWDFLPLAEVACKVSLTMSFKFNQRVALTSALLNPVFEQIIVSQIKAFEDRARALYPEQGLTK